MKLMRRHKKIIAMIVAAVMVVSGLMLCDVGCISSKASTELTGLTSNEVAKQMKRGWNLGNTFDSTGGYDVNTYETNWGNPKVTETLIAGVKNAGFNTIRIPVTWDRAMSSDGSYTINEAYLARVKQIIDWAYKYDMFVILNVHHEAWINNLSLVSNYKSIGVELEKVWEQLADYYADYDQHLIFEGMNEPRLAPPAGQNNLIEWIGNQDAYEVVNYLDQVFAATVRANGKGHNSERCLMIPGYAASSNSAVLDGITLPTYNGKVVNNLMMSVHCYAPNSFCLSDDAEDFNEDAANSTAEIDKIFSDLDTLFLSKDIPVVIGESSATNTNDNTVAREKWARYMGKKSASYGVPIVFWDNGVASNTGGECHKYVDRNTGANVYPTILSSFDAGYKQVTYGSAVTKNSSEASSLIGGSVIWQNKSGVKISVAWNTDYVGTASKESYYQTGKEIAVAYFGDAAPGLVVDSEVCGVWWLSIDSTRTATVNGYKVAYFSYDSLIAAFKKENITNTADVRNIYVMSKDGNTTVYEIATIGAPSITYKSLGKNYYIGSNMPANPSFDGLTFLGWYTTKDYKAGTEFSMGSVDKDITVYAKYKYTNEKVVQNVTTEASTEKTTEASTEKTTEASTEKTTEASTEKTTEASTEKTTEASTEKTTEASTEKTTEASTEKTTEASTEKTTEASTEKTTEASTEKTTEASTEKTTETSTEKTTEASTEKTTEASTEKTTEASTEKTTEASTEKTTEASTEKTTEASTEKTTEASTEKTTEKPIVEPSKPEEPPVITVTVNASSISSLSITSTGVNVKWNKSTNANGYYLYRSVDSGKSFAKIATIKSNATISYADSNSMTSGKKYQYKIVAYKVVDGKTYLSKASAVKSTYYVSKTSVASITNTTSGQNIKWSKNAGATGYYIYRSTDGKTYTKVKTITSNATVNYVDTGAKTNGKRYQYKIVAYKTVSNVTYKSAESAVKTNYYVSAPTVTLANASTGVNVKWTKNGSANGYYVYRSTDGKTYTKIKTITSNATVSYVDTGAKTNGKKYQYRVVAYKTVSSTKYNSANSSVKTYYYISKPTITSLTNVAIKKMVIKWNKNSNASGYQIKYVTGTTTKTITITGNTNISKTITSLTKNNTYKVYVRSYKQVGSVKYYSVWSAVKSIKITK